MIVPPIIACTLLRSDWLYALFQMVSFNDSRILFWFVKITVEFYCGTSK